MVQKREFPGVVPRSTYFVRASYHPWKLGVLLGQSSGQGLHNGWVVRAEIDEDVTDPGLSTVSLANGITVVVRFWQRG